MHTKFRESLDDAKGYSKFVIALNLDIRGFSDWSLEVDPAQSALYLKKLYAKLIDNYFSKASFFKPTGDGLLVVFDFEEEDLEKLAIKVVGDSLEIVENFGSLCSGEPMINFAVPQDLGIGIARGSAAKLASKDRTLDYSGRVLNLAARLMDLARPHGIAIDPDFGLDLLTSDLRERFHSEQVYLKGVSPKEMVPVGCWPKGLNIPEANRHPFDEPEWKTEVQQLTSGDIQASPEDTNFPLSTIPGFPDSIEATAHHAKVLSGRKKSTRYRTWHQVSVRYELRGGSEPFAVLDFAGLAKGLEEQEVRRNWPVELKVSYRLN
jgi:class 3 adenylate cyclase